MISHRASDQTLWRSGIALDSQSIGSTPSHDKSTDDESPTDEMGLAGEGGGVERWGWLMKELADEDKLAEGRLADVRMVNCGQMYT